MNLIEHNEQKFDKENQKRVKKKNESVHDKTKETGAFFKDEMLSNNWV